jgi:hypothetical protein
MTSTKADENAAIGSLNSTLSPGVSYLTHSGRVFQGVGEYKFGSTHLFDSHELC